MAFMLYLVKFTRFWIEETLTTLKYQPLEKQLQMKFVDLERHKHN